MRKITLILIVAIVFYATLSCKSTQGGHCDAYGQQQQVEVIDVG